MSKDELIAEIGLKKRQLFQISYQSSTAHTLEGKGSDILGLLEQLLDLAEEDDEIEEEEINQYNDAYDALNATMGDEVQEVIHSFETRNKVNEEGDSKYSIALNKAIRKMTSDLSSF